jgi:hypothetical protein
MMEAITVQTICTHYIMYIQQKGGKIEAETLRPKHLN